MKLFLKNVFLIATLSMLASCAYVFNKKTVEVTIDSNPQGADITIEGRNYGKTPAVLTLEPKNYNVTITKEGYGSAQLQLESWQGRKGAGEIAKCASPLDLMLFSYLTVYCRDFKESRYTVNIPYLSGASQNRQYGAPTSVGIAPQFYNNGSDYQQPAYQQYYQQQ